MRYQQPARRGATAVECTLVFPVTFLFIIGMMVGALGIFRYQELASLAREGSRYAAVRGYQYSKTTGKPAATPSDVFTTAIQPRLVALDPSNLTYSVTWSPDNHPGSMVSVQVNYHWVPEAFLGGMTLSSTSKVPVVY